MNRLNLKFSQLLILLCSLMLTQQAVARFETHNFATPQIEEDYNDLVAELRCLVCQNQNLADSNAELAQDMRLKVYKMLDDGSSKDEIVDYMVSRYGDFVMYRPSVKSSTYLLWFGPLIFLFVGGLVVFTFIRGQKDNKEAVVNTRQQEKAHSLLDDD